MTKVHYFSKQSFEELNQPRLNYSCTDKEKVSPKKKDYYHEGKVIFWTANSGYGNIDVLIEDTLVGTITSFSNINNPPDCGTYGFVTVTKPLGKYFFYAYNSNYYWYDTIEVKANCNKMRLE